MFLTTAEVALGVGILTAGSAIGATWLTSRRDRKNRELELEQERKRWEREDRLARDRAARESRAAWADKRLAAHTAFAQATRELIHWAQGGWSSHKTADGTNMNAAISEFVGKATHVNDALSELEFFCSPGLRELAEEVDHSVRNAGALAVTLLSRENDEESIENWNEAWQRAISRRREYVEVAQEEIGLLETRNSSGVEAARQDDE